MSNVIANVGPMSSPAENGADTPPRVVLAAVFSDGTSTPNMPHTPTNPDDPVSPQRDSACVGIIPPQVADGILHVFPDENVPPDLTAP